ncbi:hypothetical protein Acr_06g0013150 [Actinidia rufa]|uniref:ATP-dependent RNA helicase DHX29-like UBA domain-containing protein n=1 Tax=Actinidia rufa TaxID=165716 RepID=A0A7J0ESC2_9ERIC|nr:hypothetical protein Acr_06g0013150 [Actinidia rufa]
MESASLEAALDWLCLNLPGNELPQKFSTGTSLYMNGGGAVGIVSTAREDWSPSMDSSAKIQEETTEITLRIKGHSEADTIDLCQPSQADWIQKYLEEQEEPSTILRRFVSAVRSSSETLDYLLFRVLGRRGVRRPSCGTTPGNCAKFTENATPTDSGSDSKKVENPIGRNVSRSYIVETVCGWFLIMFVINFFAGKRENENIALAWVMKFAVKDSIFEKNFSLLGVGDSKDDDSPLLLKEGQNVFKFYASGRRFCQGLLATMELKSRHDLISKLFNLVVPCKDEITFEVYMNDEAMDHVVFAMGKKEGGEDDAEGGVGPSRENSMLSDGSGVSKVFGDKAFEKYGKGFISMHFSDQHMGMHKKVLVFKFALPDANHMAEMTRLVALVPYYIDLIGRYRMSSQARSRTEAARQKAAQEAYKELQNARQEALQKKKADRRKLIEEAEAKLSAEAIRKKEAKDRARQMKKAGPKVKMTRAH